jgi:hypothetical protein
METWAWVRRIVIYLGLTMVLLNIEYKQSFDYNAGEKVRMPFCL